MEYKEYDFSEINCRPKTHKNINLHKSIFTQIIYIQNQFNFNKLFVISNMKKNIYKNRLFHSFAPHSYQDEQSILTLSKASQLTFSKNQQSNNSTVIVDTFFNSKKDTPKLFQSYDQNQKRLIHKKNHSQKNNQNHSISNSIHSISKQKDKNKFSNLKGHKIKKIMIDLRDSQNIPQNQSQLSTSITSQKMKTSKQSTLSRQSSTSSNYMLSSKNLSNHQTVNIKVYARIRPPNLSQPLIQNSLNMNIENKYVAIQNTVYTFDQVFNQNAGQQEIFNLVAKPIVHDILDGYNGTIFAYGQTGSGKTHTMFGNNQKQQFKGIIPRTVEQIFRQIKDRTDTIYKVTGSMLQIYKQSMQDLFCLQKNELKIKQSNDGIYVQGLSEINISNSKTLLGLIQFGQQIRKVSSTRANKYSSRSHTIIIITVQIINDGQSKKGKLYLVDLAGSQKIRKSGACGQTLQQAKKINLSLSCLGNVINALTTRKSKDHIPYRDSKLTRLLQESLSGNYKTSIIVNFTTQLSSLEQTISTLKFAQRAKKIKNNIKINVKSKDSVEYLYKIIQKLTNQLQQTKTELMKLKQPEQQEVIQIEDAPSARLNIPSERANVHENMKKYMTKCLRKRKQINFEQLQLNYMNESNVICNLEFNQSQIQKSNEQSLNFSIKNEDGSLIQNGQNLLQCLNGFKKLK